MVQSSECLAFQIIYDRRRASLLHFFVRSLIFFTFINLEICVRTPYQGTVYSTRVTSWGLDFLLISTRSGFSPVMVMLASSPWEAADECRYFLMLLCLNSNILRACWQLLRKCPNMQGEIGQKRHLGLTIFFFILLGYLKKLGYLLWI